MTNQTKKNVTVNDQTTVVIFIYLKKNRSTETVSTEDVLAWISLCITGWTKLIQNERKQHNIKISTNIVNWSKNVFKFPLFASKYMCAS
jgi:uncharacterized membrane protein